MHPCMYTKISASQLSEIAVDETKLDTENILFAFKWFSHKIYSYRTCGVDVLC